MGRPATLRVDIVADARGVGPGVAEAEGKLSRLGGIGRAAGAAAAAGLAVAGVAAGKFALDSIKAASEVEQSLGALRTVYGKSSADVERWAAKAADSVGLARSEYQGLSALVGSQLQGMGVEQAKSAKQSDELIRLGADLAATYGGSVADAVGAVSSLLKGEADPIERYAVNIKQADVSARLASMGLDGLTGAAAKQAQAQATLALLTEQTTKAQGAFARESGTLAGQQERLGAKFENLKATLGERLLPVATRVVTWVSERMLPAAQRLGAFLTSRFGPAFARVGAFVTDTLVPALRSAWSWFVERIAPGIRRAVTPVLEAVMRAFDKVRDAVSDNEGELRTLGSWLRRIAEFIANEVLPIIGKFIAKGWDILGSAISTVIDIVSTLVGWFDTVIGKVQDFIDFVGRIDIPSFDIPGIDLGAVGDLATIGVRLEGGTGSLDPRTGLATGALGLSSLMPAVRSSTTGGAAVVDARSFLTVNVDGSGMVDEAKVARQLVDVLTRHAARTGRPLTPLGV